MAVVPTRPICLTELTGCQFGFLTAEEVRKLSVKHITVPLCFGKNGEVLVSGPYDQAMGPIEKFTNCVTCGLDDRGCPGHFGHIELPLPVFNPFFFPFMWKTLRSTCLHCYRLRLPEELVDEYMAQLVFLRRDELMKALSIVTKKDRSDLSSQASVLLNAKRLLHFLTVQFHIEGVAAVVKEAKQILENCSVGDLKKHMMSSHSLDYHSQISKEFMDLLQKSSKCARCGCVNPSWRKEGTLKVFISPLSHRSITHNAEKRTIPCSLLTAMPLGQKERPEMITQMEAMQILKKLWETEHQVMDIVVGGTGGGKEGYKAFFMDVMPVLPNKYRPTTVKDGRRAAHDQSWAVAKIISISLDIRSMASEVDLSEISGQGSDESSTVGTATLRKWNDLQFAVTQMIDGPQSRKVKENASIRHFLEKKEGVFRKYMMGKRVNFAARSTISPDINLDVGEVGIPPDFAKILSFPERVTDVNNEEMRRLIVRGAHQHPGAVAVEDNKGTIVDLSYLTEDV